MEASQQEAEGLNIDEPWTEGKEWTSEEQSDTAAAVCAMLASHVASSSIKVSASPILDTTQSYHEQ